MMRQEQGFTILALHPMYRLFQNKAAVEELYRILSGKTCEESVCIQVCERSCGGFSYYNFDLLVRCQNRTFHSLTIRFLKKLDDLDRFWEDPLESLFEFENEQGALCFGVPQARLLVYFLLSGALPDRKAVCRAGFPTGEDDLENYRTQMPTMVVSTEGEGDGSEISRLARYLKCPEPGNPQFGPIGKITEHWIEENAQW